MRKGGGPEAAWVDGRPAEDAAEAKSPGPGPGLAVRPERRDQYFATTGPEPNL